MRYPFLVLLNDIVEGKALAISHGVVENLCSTPRFTDQKLDGMNYFKWKTIIYVVLCGQKTYLYLTESLSTVKLKGCV